jgi:hypothetical protein
MIARSLAIPLVVGGFVVVMQHRDPAPRVLGFVREGHYHNVATGVEFPVPKDWSVVSTSGSSDGGDQVFLADASAPAAYVAVWMKKERNTPARVDVLLRQIPQRKREQRDNNGKLHYVFRPGSIQHVDMAGRRAVQATADFIGQAQPQVEYFTWILTERTRVQFDVRSTDPEASQTEARFQEIVRAARIP